MRITQQDSSRLLPAFFVALVLIVSSACGGGGAGSTSNGGSSAGIGGSSGALTITTPSILPATLMQHAYSATLVAANGQGSLTWSIAPVSSTALFTGGLAISPQTGVISGNANFAGTAGFIATVTDSASRSAAKGFTVTAYSALTAATNKALTMVQYADVGYSMTPDSQGGVLPLSFSMAGGSLPPGVRMDPVMGRLAGSPTTAGSYAATVTISDSFSPQESVSQLFNITVNEPALVIASSVPSRLPLNVPYSGAVIAVGGRPPYSFALTAGSLPSGFTALDSSGKISGTPGQLGVYPVGVQATDSSSPRKTAQGNFVITVGQALGRNDSIQSATPVGNGYFQASISPYIDPPNRAPLAADNDYYKLTSLAGSTVHIQTIARENSPNNPLDTVLELLDANGMRLSTCRQPGDIGVNYTSFCINDDVSASLTDSALDLLVSGRASTATTFYAHVFDWRGDARPDMLYTFTVSGAVSPLSIENQSLIPAARGLSYSQQLSSANGSGVITWGLASGSLPAGLTMTPLGLISGAATTDGNYVFTVAASDASAPPQTASAQFHIQVVEPIVMTSPATWPDACVNQPYSFAVKTSGGLPPVVWSYYSTLWPGFNLDQATGIFSGTSSNTGTYQLKLWASDATTHSSAQNVSVTVQTCP